MDDTRLGFEQAPPFEVPGRFLLTAPLFGVLAAGALLIGGPRVLVGRWQPQLLGATHLLTLGFLTMTMAGALLQLLPVVAGVDVPHSGAISRWVHGLLTVGTLGLAVGLWHGWHGWVVAAMVALGTSAVLLGTVVLICVRRSVSRYPSAVAMGVAGGAFVITATLGLILAAGHAGAPFGVLRYLTDLHVGWGLVGWVAVLVIGIAYQVVPMFQLTPSYPKRSMLLLIGLLPIALAVRGGIVPPVAADATIAAALVVFAVLTLRLQMRRRRRTRDVTLAYWRLGMAVLLATVALWAVDAADPEMWPTVRVPMVLGMLYIVGFAVSVVSGMLYKIVPFLAWLHMHRHRVNAGRAHTSVPTMGEIIPVEWMWRQFYLHCAGTTMLIVAGVWPQVATYPAALLLLLSWSLLWQNLWRGARCYRSFVRAS